MDLGAVMSAIIMMECRRSFVPFSFGGLAQTTSCTRPTRRRRALLYPPRLQWDPAGAVPDPGPRHRLGLSGLLQMATRTA